MAYIASSKNQNWLLPLSIKDTIPKDHICFLVEDFIGTLDYSNFDMIYDGAGHPAYHPRIIMKILIYGMLCKTRSSRKLAKASKENFVFMYLAEKATPDFRAIARFRKNNPTFVKDAFKKTVELANKNKIIDLSFISIDGLMLKANAFKKRYFDKENLDKLDKAIDKMVDEDIALDELEDEMFGDSANDGDLTLNGNVKGDGMIDYLRSCQIRKRISYWNGTPDVISGDLICLGGTRCTLAQMTTYLDDGNGLTPGELESTFIPYTQGGASAGGNHYYAVSAICCSN